MSIPKITGREARELLDIWAGDVEGLTFAQLGADRSYGDLFGAAPALAETVAWLYGREANKGHTEKVWHEGELELGGEWSVQRVSGEVDLTLFNPSTLTPDEAVDLARALLAAAEEVRP